ncbi:MAG: helix-turn-helix transcriptional regulator, partial [Marinirhabdus sp.]|nr:helix-turn-helix transcriptional regulator [Marinirhabdus sp.]
TLPFSIDHNLSSETEHETSLSIQPKPTEHNPTTLQWRDTINALFEEKKLYTNPNLTLTDGANHLDTNRNVVSNAINSEFEMNFNDFVNSWRTHQVIRLLEEKEHHGSTLLGIAMDCGFNSKTTFNRAFKKHTGLSPKQYIYKFQL